MTTSVLNQKWAEVYTRHVNLVYRLCFVYLRNTADAEDAVQTVFVKLIQSDVQFNGSEHEKAWLTVATRNHCKDLLKHWWKRRRVSLDTLPEIPDWPVGGSSTEVLGRLLQLPEVYKSVLYLYYYEEYSVREISGLLGWKESTIQTRLARGRLFQLC
ncbi:RNA polymerase sigma factor [Paenibacillus sp. CAU 1782]